MVSPSGIKNNTECFIALVGAAIGARTGKFCLEGCGRPMAAPTREVEELLITSHS